MFGYNNLLFQRVYILYAQSLFVQEQRQQYDVMSMETLWLSHTSAQGGTRV